MGTFCSRLTENVTPSVIPKKSNAVSLPDYSQRPVVEFINLLRDAEGNVPRARQMHTLVHIDEQTLLCYGGFCANIDTDDYTMDALPRSSAGLTSHATKYAIPTNRWTTVLAPKGQEPISSRALHTSALHDGAVYVFGSHTKKDPHVYRMSCATGEWEAVSTSGAAPDGTVAHTSVIAGSCMWVFGGETTKGVTSNFYCLRLDDKKWFLVKVESQVKLLPRKEHSAVVYDEKMLVFGGCSPIADESELEFIQFDANKRMWSAVPQIGQRPSGRRGHSCTMYECNMMVFGGANNKQKLLNDLWVYDVHTSLWSEVRCVDGPPPPRRAFAASCVVGAFWYLHGGGDERSLFRSLLRVDVNEISREVDSGFTMPDSRWSNDDRRREKEKNVERKLKQLSGLDREQASENFKAIRHFFGPEKSDAIWHAFAASL